MTTTRGAHRAPGRLAERPGAGIPVWFWPLTVTVVTLAEWGHGRVLVVRKEWCYGVHPVGFIYLGAWQEDPTVHRAVIDSGGLITTVVAVADRSQLLEVVAELVRDGAQSVEL